MWFRCGMLRVLGDVFGCMLSSFYLVFLCALWAPFWFGFFVHVSFPSIFFSLFIYVFPLFLFLLHCFLPTNKKTKPLTFVYIKNRVSRRKGTLLGRLSFLLVILLILANILITMLLTTASMANYPGGHALALLHSLHPRALHNNTKRKSFKRLYLYYPGW